MKFGNEAKEIRFSFGGSLTPVVKTLIWVNTIVFVFLWSVGARTTHTLLEGVQTQTLLISILGLIPRSFTQDWMFWQPFTYMFVHQQFTHLLLNMLGLYWFGSEVERYLGSKMFWRYYLVTGIGGGLAAVLWSWNGPGVTIGASGAIFGCLIAFGFLFPNRIIYLYFVIPVRAVYCVIGYSAVTVFYLLNDSHDGVSHIAHFGGMVVGTTWFLIFRGRHTLLTIWRNFRKRRMRRKLRLISRKHKSDEEGPHPNYENKTVH